MFLRKFILFLILIIILGTQTGCLPQNIDKPVLAEEDEKEISRDNFIHEDKSEEIVEVEIIEPSSITILAVGDIIFHMPQVWAAKTEEGYDFSPPFNYVKEYIQGADISIANFETVTAGNDMEFTGFPRFNSPVETLEGISSAGFDILSTINNHSLDRNKKGIINTIDTINSNGMKNIGTYKDENRDPLIEDVKGIKIGFIAYGSYLNGLDSLLKSDESHMVNKLDEELIKRDIDFLKENEVDLIVAVLHWGHEYHRKPSDSQRELALKMIHWGTDIILGSHPHVIQPAEEVIHNGERKLIVYSMGNFLSNQRYETMGNSYTEDGLMVEVVIEKDIDRTYLKEVKYIPTWIHRYREGKGMKYYILPIEDILNRDIQYNGDNIKSRLEKSYKDTFETLNTQSNN